MLDLLINIFSLLSLSFSIGEVINERDRCKTCKGKKVVNETKILEVAVDRRMKDGRKIYFRGEGNQAVSRPYTF